MQREGERVKSEVGDWRKGRKGGKLTMEEKGHRGRPVGDPVP